MVISNLNLFDRTKKLHQSFLRRLPNRSELHHPQRGSRWRRAEPQRPLHPLAEHHQREDVPRFDDINPYYCT
jgi:hypothetical protein